MEQAGRATDRIWGGGEEGAQRMGLAVVEWSGGKGKARVEVVGEVGMVGEELRSSEKVTAVERCSEEGGSGLAPARASVADGVDDGDNTECGSLGLDFGSEIGSGCCGSL
jgi:hypothetical protein